MLHTLDPYAIKLWGGFGIRWYGLSYLGGFIAAYYLFVWLANKKLLLVDKKLLSDFVFSVAIGTVIGGRLGYCIFYSPELFLRLTSVPPFWGVLAVNEGGMASHGGIIGIIVASWWFARKHGFSPRHAVDLCALAGPIGVFFGRLANFINGELVGRPCQEAYAWCVRFPQDILLWPTHEQARLAELTPVVKELGVQADSWNAWIHEFLFKRESWHSLESTLMAIIDSVQHHNYVVADELAPLLTARHPSQLYEAFLEGIFLFTVLFLLWAMPRKPGVITGAFLTVYSLVRIVGEQFRMPDAHLGYQALGLTRGQWLSAGMFILGASYLLICLRSNADRVGGWWKSK